MSEQVASSLLSTAQLRYLYGPVMHQSRSWADSVPSWLLKRIPEARLRILQEECALPGEQAPLASLEELAIIFFEASLEGPLSGEYFAMYRFIIQELSNTYPQFKNASEVFHDEAGMDQKRYVVSQLNSLRLKVRAAVVRNSTFNRHGKKKKNEDHQS